MMKQYLTIGMAMLAGAILSQAVSGLQAQTKSKTYTITEIETLDPTLAAEFGARIRPVQESMGGRNLRTGGGKVTAMEGPPPPQRVAIIEWDSLASAQAFFTSKAYVDLAPVRDKALKTIRRYAVEVPN